MKKSLLLLLAISLTIGLFAQKKVVKFNPKAAKSCQKVKAFTGAEDIDFENRRVLKSEPPKGQALLGSTEYDLQTNSSIDNRLDIHEDGTMSAVWTRGTDPVASPDRGTGFNYFDGSAWGPEPTERIEDKRVGWPSIVNVDGHDYNVAHTNLYISQNSVFGADDWTYEDVVGPFAELIWPRVAVGGPDGNTIHIVAVQGNPGDTLAYFRSTDGGDNWVDGGIPVPGFLDKFAIYTGDSYAIDAYGETVVIAYFPGYDGDVGYAKSTDNGETWSYHAVIDFPDQYEPYDGTEDIDVDGDGQPDTLITGASGGDILIDNNGVVHVAIGLMRHGPESWWPYLDGIGYWNDTRPEGNFDDDAHFYDIFGYGPESSLKLYGDNIDTIAMTPDVNGNDTIHEWIDADGYPFGILYEPLSSHPTLGVDNDNNIYVVYQTVMETEDYVKMDANPNPQHYRHVFYNVRPAATGEWLPIESAVDLTTGALDQKSSMFACLGRNEANGLMHVTFSNDEEPGCMVRGDDGDPVTTNYQIHVSFDTFIGIPEVNTSNSSRFSMYPNPVNNELKLNVEEHAQIKIYNIVGAEILTIEDAEATHTINMSSFPEGSYIVKVSDSNGVSAQKVIKN